MTASSAAHEDNRQFHGGQEWRDIANLTEDFSVTTNYLGPPKSALDAAAAALANVSHYPPLTQEPALSDLAAFLDTGDAAAQDSVRSRLILANGASEVIDLLIRMAPGTTWKAGPWDVQYMEYARSAGVHARTQIVSTRGDIEKADLICIVNPNNPTGEFLGPDEHLQWIQKNINDNRYVLVDESMLPWYSEDWLSRSLLSRKSELQNLYKSRGVAVFVIHSWTKFWCCAGLRLGSVVCPTVELAVKVRNAMVPWSVNSIALEFLSAACKDSAYAHKTWDNTKNYRRHMVAGLSRISQLHALDWSIHGEQWLSWIWLDIKNADLAERLALASRTAGTPVRMGKQGYQRGTHLRLRVCEPANVEILFKAWSECITIWKSKK